ncbi:MAG: MBL fold metallo-hydrolase, partial [Myxococcota bacterium]
MSRTTPLRPAPITSLAVTATARIAVVAALATLIAPAASGCKSSTAATDDRAQAGGKAAQSGPGAIPEHLADTIHTTVARGPGWLGTYTSSGAGFRTNSYWLEGPDGLVLIDTQFLPSAGLEAVELAESLTGKRVVAALVLHANPDKFNGTTALQERDIEVWTSAQVLELIPAVHTLRHKWFYDRYKPDYPDTAPTPKSFGNASTTLKLAGLELEVHVLGPGCSEAHVVVEHQGHVFVGDLIAGMGHSWIELGLLDEWKARLDEIAALDPERVHPGRGPSGSAALLTRQRAYLDRVIAEM